MTKVKIDISNSYQDFYIAGKDYRVDLSDDRMNRYIELFDRLNTRIGELQKIDATRATKSEKRKIRNESTDMLKALIHELFGKGAFDEIYNKTGRSLYTMAHIVDQIIKALHSKYEPTQSAFIETQKTSERLH